MSQAYPPHDESNIPGDILPPVEPPSAGFILQLFVVPGVIVAIIVMVWLLFNWVARAGGDPREDVRNLHRDNANRFQAATNLAASLRDPGPQGAALRHDAELAGDLAALLETELEEGSLKDDPIKLRYILCKALGEFEIPVGVPALVKAAGTQRGKEEAVVRLAALQAIALLAEKVATAEAGPSLDTAQVEPVVLRASEDDDPVIRKTAAVALGMIGGEQSLVRLAAMLQDSDADVRYNAAMRLAARGDARAVPVLADMLDPEETAGIDLEQAEEMRPYKRALIVTNAIRASEQLLKANPAVDFGPIRQQLERLMAADPDREQKVAAAELLGQLPSAAK